MDRTVRLLFVVLILGGSLALAPGTRTLTDIKGPVFATGATLLALAAVLAVCFGAPFSIRRGLRLFLPAAAAYLFFTSLSVLWASHPWAVRYAFADRALMLVFASSVALAASKEGAWVLAARVYAGAGSAAAVLSLYFHGIHTHTIRDVKFPMGNANLLGVFLVLTILMNTGLALDEWKLKRRKWLLALYATADVLMVVVFVLARSLSAGIALAAAGGIFVFLQSRRKKLLAVAGFLAVGLFFSVFLLAGGLENFRRTQTYIVRVELYRRALRMAADRPAAGWGAGNFFTDNAAYAADTAGREVMFHDLSGDRLVPLYTVSGPLSSHAHNEYMQQAAEGGIIGLILYAAVIVIPLLSAFAARRGKADTVLLDAGVAVYVSFLLANAITANMRFADFAPHFWILAGMLVGAGTLCVAGRRRLGFAARSAIALMAFCAALFSIWTFAVGDWQSSAQFARGKAHLAAGDLSAAREQLVATAQKTWDPVLRARAFHQLGYCYLAGGQFESAYLAFNSADSEVTGFVDFEMGLALERTGFCSRAIVHYNSFLAAHPDDQKVTDRILFCNTVVSVEDGRLGDGISLAHDYFQRHPADRVSRRIYMRKLLDANVPVAELDWAVEPLATSPMEHEDLFLAAMVDLVDGRADRCITVLEQIKSEGYHGAGSNSNRARAYIALGRFSDARGALGQGLLVHPGCRSLNRLRALLNVIDASKSHDGKVNDGGKP